MDLLLLAGRTFHLKTYKWVCACLTVTNTLVSHLSSSHGTRFPDQPCTDQPHICPKEHSWKGPALKTNPHTTQGGELFQDERLKEIEPKLFIRSAPVPWLGLQTLWLFFLVASRTSCPCAMQAAALRTHRFCACSASV